jgi:glycosyltransferase involved in cell wall biosynthesis
MSHQPTPLISIIVAVFNGAATLQQCIDSVAQQTYPNKELIVIDGGSSDGTVELLQANHEKLTYWISESDGGIYSAWNKGLARAQGEWICFLGADDYFWNAQALAQMTELLAKLPSNIGVAYAPVMLVNAEGEQLYPVGEPWGKLKERFKQLSCIWHQGVMHRRSLFERHGQFDETFRIAGDYELLLRELKNADAVFIPDVIITAMRQGGISNKPANTLQTMRELRRAQKMHGQSRPGRLWLMATARVYVRLLLWNLIGEQATRRLLDTGRRIIGQPAYWTKT